MLRRNIRDIYQLHSPTQKQKDQILEQLLEERTKSTELRGKKWRAKGQIGSWILIVLVVALLLAIGYQTADHFGLTDLVGQKLKEITSNIQKQLEEAQSSDPSDDDGTAEPSETIPEAVPAAYKDIVDVFVTAIEEDWDSVECEEAGISYMVMFLDKPEQLSYALMDLDDNGVKELILTDGNVIYDLYTAVDGGIVHVLSGAERNSYMLTEENILINTASNGAASTVFTFYRYSNGNLIVDQMVVLDAIRDEQNPWFKGFSIDNLEPVTELHARQILDSYVQTGIPCESITTYN